MKKLSKISLSLIIMVITIATFVSSCKKDDAIYPVEGLWSGLVIANLTDSISLDLIFQKDGTLKSLGGPINSVVKASSHGTWVLAGDSVIFNTIGDFPGGSTLRSSMKYSNTSNTANGSGFDLLGTLKYTLKVTKQ